MKRRKAIELWKCLSSLENLKHDVRFSYFIAKNKVLLKQEVELIEASHKPSTLFMEYEMKRVELAVSMADKDAAGNPKIHNGQYVIQENKTEFEDEIKKLRTKFKKAIEEREKQLDDYEKFLDEDIELGLGKIKLETLPPQIEPLFLQIFIESGVLYTDEGF